MKKLTEEQILENLQKFTDTLTSTLRLIEKMPYWNSIRIEK